MQAGLGTKKPHCAAYEGRLDQSCRELCRRQGLYIFGGVMELSLSNFAYYVYGEPGSREPQVSTNYKGTGKNQELTL